MNREEFFNLAKKHGWQEDNKAVNVATLKQELLTYFSTSEGQKDISEAPPWHREALIETIVEALLAEVLE